MTNHSNEIIEELIEIVIKFTNLDNREELMNFIVPKNELLTSKYFRSVFDENKNYIETKQRRIVVDLQDVIFPTAGEYIKLFIHTMINTPQPKIRTSLNIIYGNTFEYNIKILFGIDIPFYDFVIILQLNDFFLSSTVGAAIQLYYQNFGEFIDYLINFFEASYDDKRIESPNWIIIEDIQLTYEQYPIMGKEIDLLKVAAFVNDFIANIYSVYISFQMLGLLDEFKTIVDKIVMIIELYTRSSSPSQKKDPGGTQTYTKNGDNIFKINKLVINVDTLKKLPLIELHNLIFYCFDLMDIKFCELRLDEFRDIEYEEPEVPIYVIEGMNKRVIKPKTECIRDNIVAEFHNRTNNIFNDFVWDGVVVAGGFVYALITNLNNGFIDSTDIDLFVYNDNKNVIQRILRHFSKFDPIYGKNGNLITVFIPDLGYDIQIIPSYYSKPFNIVNKFDLNYVSAWFDGQQVFVTLECLIGLKYNLAMFRLPGNDMRVYKTIKKGLDIRINNIINSKYIIGDTILKDIQKDEQIQKQMQKSKLIRKLLLVCAKDECCIVLQNQYKLKHATYDLNQIIKYCSEIDNLRLNQYSCDILNPAEVNFNMIRLCQNPRYKKIFHIHYLVGNKYSSLAIKIPSFVIGLSNITSHQIKLAKHTIEQIPQLAKHFADAEIFFKSEYIKKMIDGKKLELWTPNDQIAIKITNDTVMTKIINQIKTPISETDLTYLDSDTKVKMIIKYNCILHTGDCYLICYKLISIECYPNIYRDTYQYVNLFTE